MSSASETTHGSASESVTTGSEDRTPEAARNLGLLYIITTTVVSTDPDSEPVVLLLQYLWSLKAQQKQTYYVQPWFSGPKPYLYNS